MLYCTSNNLYTRITNYLHFSQQQKYDNLKNM